MRFALLLAEARHFDTWDDADAATRERVADDFEAFGVAAAQRGAVIGAEAFARPECARTLRPGRGPDRAVTDGPYADTVEELGGLYVLDVASIDVALELAALLPSGYSVEVRPVLEAAT